MREFEMLLRTMVESGASDLYLKVNQHPIIRVSGALENTQYPAVTAELMQSFTRCVLSQQHLARFETHPDVDVAYLSPESHERYRINVFRQRGHPGMVVRWVRGGGLNFRALGLPEDAAAWCNAPHGLIIVCGPTGSGKSTTLSAMVEQMNADGERRRHIVTIEDPIEYLYTDRACLIEQREVGSDTHSFSDALRHVVRQSPDVILIGEMRDLDTMRVALSAAMTGHLVLTTLHTTDAVGTIERIQNYFPPDQQQFVRVELSQSLVGVLCQRLVPSADGTGRIPAAELLGGSALVRKYIQEGNSAGIAELLHTGRVPEAVSFQRSLWHLVNEGRVREDVALAYSPNAEELQLHLSGMYSGIPDARKGQPPTDTPAPPSSLLPDPPQTSGGGGLL